MRRSALTGINLPGVAAIAVCVGLWEIYARTFGASFDSIAPSSAIISAIKDSLLEGALLTQLWHTTSTALAGWIIASAAGLVIGLSVGMSNRAWTYSMASFDVLRSIPSISFVPIAVLWFGFSLTTELIIVVYVAIWPVLLATLNSVHSTSAEYLDVSRVFHLSKAATLLKIRLPAALPTVLVSLRLSLTLSIALAVVAEMIGNPQGLGYGMVSAQQAVQPAQAFGYLIVIGILGWAFNVVLILISRGLARGHQDAL